jgi:hypothetical protein
MTMKKAIVVLALFVAGLWSFVAAAGEPIAIARAPDGDSVALYTDKCAEKELIALVAPAYKEAMYKAVAVYKGTEHKACYTVLPNGGVGIVDDEGDLFSIPQAAFMDPKAKAPLPRGQVET